jgi:hypothetical protein
MKYLFEEKEFVEIKELAEEIGGFKEVREIFAIFSDDTHKVVHKKNALSTVPAKVKKSTESFSI